MAGKPASHLPTALPVCLFILTLLSGCSIYPLTPPESWVLRQVNAGKGADLLSYSPEGPNGRVLRGRFIEGLLCGTILFPKVSPPLGYVVIKGARIVGEVTLDNAEIRHEVILADCELLDRFSGRGTVWGKPLLVLGGLFGEVDFEGAKFACGVRVNNTKFLAGLRLHSATCEGLLSVSDCDFRDPSGRVDCEFMIITGDTLFTDVRMRGPVSFNRSRVTGTLDITRGTFLERSSPANFSMVRIGGDCELRETTFAEGALYYGAVIGGDLSAGDCRFGSGSGETSFRMASIGGNVVFKRVMFNGRLDLGGMEYTGITVDDGPKMWDGVFALIDRADYDRDVYERLEKYSAQARVRSPGRQGVY